MDAEIFIGGKVAFYYYDEWWTVSIGVCLRQDHDMENVFCRKPFRIPPNLDYYLSRNSSHHLIIWDEWGKVWSIFGGKSGNALPVIFPCIKTRDMRVGLMKYGCDGSLWNESHIHYMKQYLVMLPETLTITRYVNQEQISHKTCYKSCDQTTWVLNKEDLVAWFVN